MHSSVVSMHNSNRCRGKNMNWQCDEQAKACSGYGQEYDGHRVEVGQMMMKAVERSSREEDWRTASRIQRTGEPPA